MEAITESARETRKFAGKLAKRFLLRAYSAEAASAAKAGQDFGEHSKKSAAKAALVIALEGELGSGKTTFIKGFSKALGVRGKILSPTFVLIHKHKLKNFQFSIFNFQFLYHIDAYRLKSAKELTKLGVKKIFANPENIAIIEWADRVRKIIPKTALWIKFEHTGKNKRKILIK